MTGQNRHISLSYINDDHLDVADDEDAILVWLRDVNVTIDHGDGTSPAAVDAFRSAHVVLAKQIENFMNIQVELEFHSIRYHHPAFNLLTPFLSQPPWIGIRTPLSSIPLGSHQYEKATRQGGRRHISAARRSALKNLLAIEGDGFVSTALRPNNCSCLS